MIFSWYYKGFKLLRRYFVKHPSGVDLENLDFEVEDKEMEINEASWATVAILEENVLRELVVHLRALLPVQLVLTRLLFSYSPVYQNFILPFPFFFFGRCLVCFWALHSDFETIFLPSMFLGFKY